MGAAIARAAQMMGVHARHLRRHIRPDPEQTPALLVRQFEGLQIQIVTRAGQQGLEVVDEGGHDQFIAPTLVKVE